MLSVRRPLGRPARSPAPPKCRSRNSGQHFCAPHAIIVSRTYRGLDESLDASTKEGVQQHDPTFPGFSRHFLSGAGVSRALTASACAPTVAGAACARPREAEAQQLIARATALIAQGNRPDDEHPRGYRQMAREEPLRQAQRRDPQAGRVAGEAHGHPGRRPPESAPRAACPVPRGSATAFRPPSTGGGTSGLSEDTTMQETGRQRSRRSARPRIATDPTGGKHMTAATDADRSRARRPACRAPRGSRRSRSSR